MAEKKTESQNVQVPVETFEAKEIAQNAQHLFGYSTDLANAALILAKVERCTLDEAKKIIKEFAERKVK